MTCRVSCVIYYVYVFDAYAMAWPRVRCACGLRLRSTGRFMFIASTLLALRFGAAISFGCLVTAVFRVISISYVDISTIEI